MVLPTIHTFSIRINTLYINITTIKVVSMNYIFFAMEIENLYDTYT